MTSRLTIGTAGLLVLLAHGSGAQVRDTKVVPERPARVFVMAGVDDACRPLLPVTIAVQQEPSQGRVTFRQNQASTIQTSAAGKCLGARAVGTGIYYTANAGARGRDRFSITARLGELSTERTFDVEIADD